MAVKFTKSINYNPNYPTFIKVAEETSNAVKGNNGKWYLSEEHFSQLEDGEYLVEHLPSSLFAAPVVKVWSKEEYCNELNEAHTQLFRSLYTGRGYMSYAEVESWARTTRTDARSLAWKAEAQSIIDWFQSTCIALYDYMDNVTEETAQTIETFINSLPKFEN